MQRDQRQGQLLIERGLLAPEMVRTAFRLPWANNEDLCAVLIKNGYLAQKLAQQIRDEVAQELARSEAQIYNSAQSQSHFALESLPQLNSENPATQRQKALTAYKAVFSQDPRFSPHADVVFKQGKQLGVGGMGVVFQVEDTRLDRQAALKLMKAEQNDPDETRRFWREARITARLDHPSIPPVYESGTTTSGQNYLLMRFIEGRTFAESIKDYHLHGRAEKTLRSLLEVLLKVAEAVAYAHSRRVIHRDLKPDNIMVGQFGEVMVMDWGLARDFSEKVDSGRRSYAQTRADSSDQTGGLTQSGDILGTPGYMSPEQARSQEVDEKTDVFSLGCILVEVLTGAAPIEGKTAVERIRATLNGEIILPGQRRRGIAGELQSICAASLALDSQSRMESAALFAENLKAYLSGERVSSHHYSLNERFKGWLRRYSVSVVVTMLALAFMLVGGLVFLQMESAKANQALAENAEKRMTETVTRLSKAEALARRRARSELIFEHAEPALKAGERKEWLLLKVARIYADAKLYEACRVLLEEVISRFPPGFEALHFLHQIELESGTKASQKKAYERFLSVAEKLEDDKNEYYLRAMALKAHENKDYKKALRYFQRIEDDLEIERSSDFYFRAKCYEAQKLLEKAYNEYSRAVDLDASRWEYWSDRAGVLYQLRRMYPALNDVNRALALNSKDVESLLIRSDILQNLGDRESALKDVEKVIVLAPKFAMGYNERGLIRLNKKQYVEAIKDLSQAIELSPEDPIFYLNRGTAYCQSKRYEEGLRDYNRALQRDPDFVECLKSRGQVFVQRRNYEKAVVDAEKAFNLSPKRLDLMLFYCQTLTYVGRYDQAMIYANKMLGGNYRNFDSYFCRGVLYFTKSRYPSAIRDFTAAISASGGGQVALNAYFNRGICYRSQNQNSLALRDFSQAIAFNPRNPEAYYRRGDTHFALRNYQAAYGDLAKALQLAPNNPKANQMREMMKRCQSRLRGQ